MSHSPESSSPKGSPMKGLRAVAHSLIRHASSSSPEPVRALRKGSGGERNSNPPSPLLVDSRSGSPINSKLESLQLDKPNTPPPPPPPLPDSLLLSTGFSQATLDKVQLTKHFLSQYYYGLFAYLKDRAERFDQLDITDSIRKRKVEEECTQKNATFLETITAKTAFFVNETEVLRLRRRRMILNDFQSISQIGKGGFGNVFLVRHKRTGNVYAMKRVNKQQVLSRNQVHLITTEQEILSKIKAEWLIQLHYSWQDNDYLYLVMEYAPGGDLRSLLTNVGFFPEADAKFYIAEMIIAVSHLHKMGYIHRDLKPDNFLLSKEGHIKLADFGLSKKGMKEFYKRTVQYQEKPFDPLRTSKESAPFRERSKTVLKNRRELAYSMVGSPDYMAHELLTGEGYSFSVDNWSIGIILFELISGIPPFAGDTPEETFNNIRNYEVVLRNVKESLEGDEDIQISPVCWDLIEKLICDPEERLGKENIEQIFEHPFFSDLSIPNILSHTPPFVPHLANDWDLQYFSTEEKEINFREFLPIGSWHDPSTEIKNFTFKRK